MTLLSQWITRINTNKKQHGLIQMELIYQDESYQMLGAAMHVYNVLGPGFVEAVYHKNSCYPWLSHP